MNVLTLRTKRQNIELVTLSLAICALRMAKRSAKEVRQ